jgi:hypothetical protein
MKLTDLESGIFLPGRDYGKTINFTKNDNEKLFKKNLKTQPADWIYRNKTVQYSFNSRGYRTKEFADIDWKDSVVVFGCSYVFGEGLDTSDTITTNLQQLIGRPVINLGARGASVDFCHFNSIILSNSYPSPYAVVFLWPNISRTTMFYDSNWTGTVGAWNLPENRHLEYWFENTHMQQIQAKLYQMGSQQIWKSKTKFVEASFFDLTVDTLGCPKLEVYDKARDLNHPGIETAKSVAKYLASNIV